MKKKHEVDCTDQNQFQKKLTTSIINVKSRLIPLILTLIAGFGVTQVNKLIAKGMPEYKIKEANAMAQKISKAYEDILKYKGW